MKQWMLAEEKCLYDDMNVLRQLFNKVGKNYYPCYQLHHTDNWVIFTIWKFDNDTVKWFRSFHVKKLNSNMLSTGHVTYLGKIDFKNPPASTKHAFWEGKSECNDTRFEWMSKEHGKFAVAWTISLVLAYVCVELLDRRMVSKSNCLNYHPNTVWSCKNIC